MTSPIFRLCDQYVTRWASLDPVLSGMAGVSGAFAPATDYSPDGHEARARLIRDTLSELARLDPTGDADVLAATHLRERLEAELAEHDIGQPLRDLNVPFGLINVVRDSVDLLPRRTDDDWRDVAARLAAIPEMLSGWRASLETGLGRGLPAARRQALESAEQADRYAGLSGDAPAHQELVGEYEPSGGPVGAELSRAAGAAHDAYAETARWLRETYAPHATETDGVGPERYAVAARLYLGDDVDVQDAYEWGWHELRRIEDEIAGEVAKIKPGASPDEAIALLDETAVVEGEDAYLAWLRERHDQALERLHGVHFDIPEPIRKIDVVLARGSTSGSPYYTPPTEDMSRPGRTWWPLAGRERFTVWGELTTVFHEGVPGHHLQEGATRLAGESLSRYAKNSWVSGHGEGWAQYSERLADELGWFEEYGTRLGMLCASALRAARVVIDIGVHLDLPLPEAEARRHGPRWTFDVALDVLRNRGRCEPHNVRPEVIRYFGWPAQAISYKLGERAWLAAREEARRRQGGAFDLKAWHTAALSLGPVGLKSLADTLRRIA